MLGGFGRVAGLVDAGVRMSSVRWGEGVGGRERWGWVRGR